MEARNAKGDSSAQVGPRDTVLREGNESQTQAYGVRVFLPRGSFYCFVPVATQPAVPFSLKNPVGCSSEGAQEALTGTFFSRGLLTL